jgi:Lrp/AsnC family transcriptional regulator for asnA, asnC and gidA
MDEIDYLILSQLLIDAQLSFLEIGKKIGISSFTIKRRFDKMKRAGVILGTVVNIDLSKLGYQGKMFMLITSAPDTTKSAIIESLRKMKNIFVVTEIIGPYDILAIAPIVDLDSITALVQEVKTLPGVQKVQIVCINNTQFPLGDTFGKVLSEHSRCLAMSTAK